jgi:hypothetical protein
MVFIGARRVRQRPTRAWKAALLPAAGAAARHEERTRQRGADLHMRMTEFVRVIEKGIPTRAGWHGSWHAWPQGFSRRHVKPQLTASSPPASGVRAATRADLSSAVLLANDAGPTGWGSTQGPEWQLRGHSWPGSPQGSWRLHLTPHDTATCEQTRGH